MQIYSFDYLTGFIVVNMYIYIYIYIYIWYLIKVNKCGNTPYYFSRRVREKYCILKPTASVRKALCNKQRKNCKMILIFLHYEDFIVNLTIIMTFSEFS